MRIFNRRFNLNRFEDVLPDNSWMQDLLGMWAPAGTRAPFDGARRESARIPCLRMSVRDPGLDMYRLGQCLASINFGPDRGLRSNIHQKYVADGVDGQAHARLNCAGLHRSGHESRRYEGHGDLISWLDRAEDYKRGKEREKKFVDEVCGENANVIDLEMGLPAVADAKENVATRMDLVALEPTKAGGWRIVFWEAKLAKNAELRRPRDEQKKGNIYYQVKTYKDWIGSADNAGHVADAYWNTCKILVGLHRIAQEFGLHIAPLGDGITAVAQSALPPEVDYRPRVIIDHRDAETSSLLTNGHLDRLRSAGIHTQVVYDAAGLVLGLTA